MNDLLLYAKCNLMDTCRINLIGTSLQNKTKLKLKVR